MLLSIVLLTVVTFGTILGTILTGVVVIVAGVDVMFCLFEL